MRRTYVVDDGVGAAPDLAGTLLATAIFGSLLTVSPVSMLAGVAAAAIGFASLRAAGWRFVVSHRRATIDEEGATFVMGRGVQQVEHSDVADWLVEEGREGAVLLAHTTDGERLPVLTVAPRAEASLTLLAGALATAGLSDRPDGGYRQAPNDTRAGGRDVEVVRLPAGAWRGRISAAAFLVLWPLVWVAAGALFTLEGPRVPILAWPAAMLGALALVYASAPVFRSSRQRPASGWRRLLRFPRARAVAWPLATICAVASAALFAYEIRPHLHETNVRACDGGDGESCWWAAKKMLLRGEELEAIPYLERACHGGVGDACSYRAPAIERLDAVRAQAMLERGCELDDVSSCVMLASFMRRRRNITRAEEAATRACVLDARRCND